MRTALPTFATLLISLFIAGPAAAAVTATIVDEDGKPIAGATVQAFARETRQAAIARVLAGKSDAPPVATAQSAANGTVRLDVGKTPVVMLLVTAQGRSAIAEAADGDDLGPVMLPASSTSKGKVTAGGKPIAGALVALGNRILGRTNAEGVYEVPESALSGRVLVVHPDYAISDTPIAQSFDRELSAGVAIRGRVLGADGKPVPHAALSIEGNPHGESADDGSFVIAHAPADWATIVARTATLAGMAKRSSAPSMDIRLRPAALVSGVVRDTKSQAGVPGMRLTITAQHDTQQAITDAKGAFSFPAMTAGRYEVLSTHPAFYFERARSPLELAEGQKETSAWGAVPFGRIRGSVIDDERKPVAAAAVTSISPFATDGPRSTATNAAGEFTVRMPEAPRSVLGVTRNGYAATLTPIAVAAGETKSGVTITLHRGIPLHVQVVDADRAPVRGVNVNFMRWNDETGNDTTPTIGCSRPRCNMTDASGAVDLRLAEGRYDIFLAGETIVTKRQQGETITARSSPLTVSVERGVEVSGRVVYSDGSPVPNVMVRSMSLRNYSAGGTTDASGAFTIRNARRGHDTLMVEGPNRTTGTQKEVDIPASGIVLTLPKPGQISGRVTDAASKQPITTFTVTAVRRGMGSMPMMPPQAPQSPVQSEDGTFTVESPSGAVEAQVTAPGYARGTATGIDVEEGKTVSGVEVHLERGAKISGKVTANGAPVSGVSVSLGRSGMPMMPPMMFGRAADGTTTDANGDYMLDSVTPGDQMVVFAKSGYVALRKSIEATGGKESRLDAELSRGNTFSGRVVDEAGRPVADADVRAPGGGNARTDAEGAFRLEGISDARTTLLARKSGYLEARAQNADASAAVTITLRRGGTITGRVVGLSPEELASTMVMASAPGESVRGRVEPDGRFALQGVPDGRVSVSAFFSSQPPRQSASKMVDVVDGSAPPVELDFGGFTVRGHVTRGGKPVESGNVFFQPMDRTKQSPATVQVRGPAGEYVATGLTAGEYKIVVYVGPTPGSTEQLTVTGDMTHDINVRGGVLRGRVVDAGTGAPVSDVAIAVDPMMRAAVTDSEGRFVVDVGEDAVYHLHTQKDRYAPASQDVTVSGGVAPDVELRIAPAEGTLVSVVDATTRQGVDASVFVSDAVTHRMVFSGQALAGEDGMVRVYAAAGTYEISANARGYAPTRVTVPLPGAEVRLELRRGGTIVIQSRSGAEIKGMLVPDVATGRRITVIQPTVPNVPPGNYTLEIGSSKYPVIVVEGQTVTVMVE